MKLSEREAYIALNLIQDMGPITARLLAEALGGSVAAIWSVEPRRLPVVRGVGRQMAAKLEAARRHGRTGAAEEERAATRGLTIVTPADAGYPEPLRTIHDPPLALYMKGAWQPSDRKAVAIVGSRRTTPYGREAAARFAFELAQAGYTVVSGLARGIDTSAHQGAMSGEGRTLAVLGGGLHDVYPPENRELAGAIAAAGAVMSEFPLGREPDKTTFPIRNRVVSGLSQAVLVVEAGLTSGAMITARLAAEQGRSVLAVPGRIDNLSAQGPHELIRSGARLAENLHDVLDELGALFRGGPLRPPGAGPGAAEPGPPLSDAEQAILTRLREEERLDVDTLTRQSGLPAQTVSATLLMLEMKRLVRILPGRWIEPAG